MYGITKLTSEELRLRWILFKQLVLMHPVLKLKHLTDITGQDLPKLFTSQNKRGCNPLMTAAEFESNDVLQYLLQYIKGHFFSDHSRSPKKTEQKSAP